MLFHKNTQILEKPYFFTSESVTEGHPDKLSDLISDAVVDAVLALDPYARVACEVAVTTNFVLIMGEISAEALPDIEQTAREVIRETGYVNNGFFSADTCEIIIRLDKQSVDIATGVNRAADIRDYDINTALQTGAGDQGIVFGYACRETPYFMPLPIHLAHQLTRLLSQVRRNGDIPYLLPDGKSQVTVEYNSGKPKRIDTIVVSAQHCEDIQVGQLREDIYEHVILPGIPLNLLDAETRVLINPTGRFVIGGPQGDSGLTGRKLMVDTYGGYARHGGGAFSGKDPTKVDRSGAYMARYIAKNLVNAGTCDQCEVQIAYAIGHAHPVSIHLDTKGTEKIDMALLYDVTQEVFDMRPGAIIEQFQLRRPIYQKTAAYGHFGRTAFEWEKLDKKDAIINRILSSTIMQPFKQAGT